MQSFVRGKSQKASVPRHSDQAYVRYKMPVRVSSPHQQAGSPTKTSTTSQNALKLPTKSSRFSVDMISKNSHTGFDTDSEAADTTTITSFQQDHDDDHANEQFPGQPTSMASDDYQDLNGGTYPQLIPEVKGQLDLPTTIDEDTVAYGIGNGWDGHMTWNASESYPESDSDHGDYQDEISEPIDLDPSQDRPEGFGLAHVVARQSAPPYQQPLKRETSRDRLPEMQDSKSRVHSKQRSHQNTPEPQSKVIHYNQQAPAGQSSQIPGTFGQTTLVSTALEPQLKMYASHKAAKRSRFQYRTTFGDKTDDGAEKESDIAWATDYERSKLADIPFEQLQDEDMDHDPNAETNNYSQEHSNEEIDNRLNQLISETPDVQAKFFQALNLQQWEEAGDWFLSQFQRKMTGFIEIRKAKREITRDFERRVTQRHGEVKTKDEDIEGALSAMRASGKSLLNATPTRTPRRKP